MLHKELGAYLIALGTQMMAQNKSLSAVADDIELDNAIIDSMMAHGLSQEKATEVAIKTGHSFVRVLNRKTYASSEEQAAKEAAYVSEDWDDDDDEDGDDAPSFTRGEIEADAEIVLRQYLGDGVYKRMRHYDLTLGDVASDLMNFFDFADEYAESFRLNTSNIPDLSSFTFKDLVDFVFKDLNPD